MHSVHSVLVVYAPFLVPTDSVTMPSRRKRAGSRRVSPDPLDASILAAADPEVLFPDLRTAKPRKKPAPARPPDPVRRRAGRATESRSAVAEAETGQESATPRTKQRSVSPTLRASKSTKRKPERKAKRSEPKAKRSKPQIRSETKSETELKPAVSKPSTKSKEPAKPRSAPQPEKELPKETAKIGTPEASPKTTELSTGEKPPSTGAAPKSPAKLKRRLPRSRRRRRKRVPGASFGGFQPYKRSKGEPYMSESQRDHFRDILIQWRRQLKEEVDRTVNHMQDEAKSFAETAEQAAQEEEFSIKLKTRDRERQLISKINSTLDQIDKDYGYCDSCGAEIGIPRLEARPTARLCIDCKERDEIRERQQTG